MNELIAALDDATAVRVLSAYAAARARAGDFETELTPALSQALADEFEVASPARTITDGELARQALQLLAEDPQEGTALTALIKGPAAKPFSPEVLLLAGTAALIALQSRLKIKRDKNGNWQFEFEAKPTPPAILKVLVQKVIGWFGGQPSG